MKESTAKKKIWKMMVSILFIGGAAALLGMVRTAKDALQPIDYV